MKLAGELTLATEREDERAVHVKDLYAVIVLVSYDDAVSGVDGHAGRLLKLAVL